MEGAEPLNGLGVCRKGRALPHIGRQSRYPPATAGGSDLKLDLEHQ